MGSGRISLIPVPDWPSLIKPRWVEAPAFLGLSFVAAGRSWRGKGKGKSARCPLPAALFTLPHTSYLPFAFLDSSTPPKGPTSKLCHSIILHGETSISILD
jgi:hypothetical protein